MYRKNPVPVLCTPFINLPTLFLFYWQWASGYRRHTIKLLDSEIRTPFVAPSAANGDLMDRLHTAEQVLERQNGVNSTVHCMCLSGLRARHGVIGFATTSMSEFNSALHVLKWSTAIGFETTGMSEFYSTLHETVS